MLSKKHRALFLLLVVLCCSFLARTEFAHAQITATVNQSALDGSQFYYEVMDVKSGDTTNKKLSIYSIRCNYTNNKKECDPRKIAIERWLVTRAGNQLADAKVWTFDPVDVTSGTRDPNASSSIPSIVVSRDKLAEGGITNSSLKTFTFLIKDTKKAEDFIKVDNTAGADKPSDGFSVPVVEKEEDAIKPTCESEGLDLSWIMCPLLSLGDKVVRTLDTEVTRLLEVPNEYLEKKDSEGKIPVEEAWMRIRSIAYIILIPVMLVMIISTALGFEFISAYTLKKSMPRLIAAVLFITLSFEICKFLIILTNDVGMGMNGLITSAFTGSGDVSLANIFSPDGGDSILTGAGLVAAGGAALALGSIGILFSYMFVAVVSMGLAFFLLSFRQMLIIALVLLSPLAVIAWIFPGNDKLWKLWWGTFSKLLLLFPLIMILIAAGKSFAVLVDSVGDDSLVNTLLKLIAYIGPFFLIPATFKFAGGVFATASGMANDRGRGLFDRQKKYRGRKAGENYRDFKAGDKSWRPRAFNNLGERAGVGLGGRFGIGARGQASIQKQRRNNAAERMSKDEELKQLALSSDDGNAVMALSGGTNEGARAAAEDLRESWVAGGLSRSVATDRANSALNDALAVGVNRSRSQAAFSTMMQNKARAISGGEEGRQVFERGLNRLHGESAPNDAALDETRQAARYFARESGRADLGGETVVNGFTRTGAYKAIRGYEPAVVALMTDLTARHNDARTRGDQADMFETSAQITAVRNAMGQDMSEGNKQAVTAMLVGTGIDISSTRSVDQQLGTQINPVDPGGATEMIRDRVGLYDSGELTQAQLVARQNQINNPN